MIQFKRSQGAKPPRRTHVSDADYDLPILYDVVIYPGKLEIVLTGLYFAIPNRYYRQVQLRSSIAKQVIFTKGGVIDSRYMGDIKLLLGNRSPTEIIKLYDRDYIT